MLACSVAGLGPKSFNCKHRDFDVPHLPCRLRMFAEVKPTAQVHSQQIKLSVTRRSGTKRRSIIRGPSSNSQFRGVDSDDLYIEGWRHEEYKADTCHDHINLMDPFPNQIQRNRRYPPVTATYNALATKGLRSRQPDLQPTFCTVIFSSLSSSPHCVLS